MELGKLYQIKEDFWFVYPEKHRAALTSGINHSFSWGLAGEQHVANQAVNISKSLRCNVTYLSPKTILFPIETDVEYVKVISGEGVGWMVVIDVCTKHFEELKENQSL